MWIYNYWIIQFFVKKKATVELLKVSSYLITLGEWGIIIEFEILCFFYHIIWYIISAKLDINQLVVVHPEMEILQEATENFLAVFVTMEESWIYNCDAETKRLA